MSFESDKKSKMDETNVESKTKTLNSEFSPKDKLLLICSPLGGYSLLDKEKYPHEHFADLYHLRWNEEEGYKLYKCRCHLEAFSGKTSVRDLAMLLRDADAVVTNDSGPMHLANAVGAPLVTFIGAADPVETEPFNQGKRPLP
mgnify:CR=1 FL=1